MMCMVKYKSFPFYAVMFRYGNLCGVYKIWFAFYVFAFIAFMYLKNDALTIRKRVESDFFLSKNANIFCGSVRGVEMVAHELVACAVICAVIYLSSRQTAQDKLCMYEG